MQLHGKQRLVLVGLVAAAVVAALTIAGSRGSSDQHDQSTPTAQAGVTAGPGEVARLTSWALMVNELPPGTHLRSRTEFPNFAAANNDPQRQRDIEATGRVTGYAQQWRQDTAQYEFLDETALYQTAAQAKTKLASKPTDDPKIQITDLPDPRLGDASRMYTYVRTESGGLQLESYVVVWVRGRVLLLIQADSLKGGLTGDQVLTWARDMDGRAAQAPIK